MPEPTVRGPGAWSVALARADLQKLRNQLRDNVATLRDPRTALLFTETAELLAALDELFAGAERTERLTTVCDQPITTSAAQVPRLERRDHRAGSR